MLCQAMRRTFMYRFSHWDRRWGHESRSFLVHSVQLGFGWVSDQKRLFLWFHIYCT